MGLDADSGWILDGTSVSADRDVAGDSNTIGHRLWLNCTHATFLHVATVLRF